MYATSSAFFAVVSSATAFHSAEQENKDKPRQIKFNLSEFQTLTLGALSLLLQLCPRSIYLLLERRQGSPPLFEGGLYVAEGHPCVSRMMSF